MLIGERHFLISRDKVSEKSRLFVEGKDMKVIHLTNTSSLVVARRLLVEAHINPLRTIGEIIVKDGVAGVGSENAENSGACCAEISEKAHV